MRIPNLTMSDALVSRLNTLNVKQTQLNDQLASGQRISLASEDPEAANRIMGMRSEQSNLQVYTKNADRVLSVAQASYSALDQLQNISSRASELAALSNSDNVSPSERKAYAVELNQLVKSAIDAGNTTFQGEYLFNGANTSVQPFADDGLATPAALATSPATTVSSANVTSGSATIEIPDTTIFAKLAVGQTVTGSGIPANSTILSKDTSVSPPTITLSNAATATGTPSLSAAYDGGSIAVSNSLSITPFTSGTSNAKIADFITRLIALRDGLNNTAGASDDGTAAITTARANLLTSENDIIGIIADNASMQTRIEAVQTQATTRFNNLSSTISKDGDVDVAQTTVNLTRARTAYQAAMQAGAQMLKMSLLDYIP